MPTYDYRCAKCGDELEVFQTFAEKPLVKHAGCGGKLSKVLSPAGIVLKGSGFYKTDNRSSSKRSAAESENGSKSSDNGSSSGTSEASSDSKSSDSGKSDSGKSGSEKSGSGKSDAGTPRSSNGSASKPSKPAAKSA